MRGSIEIRPTEIRTGVPVTVLLTPCAPQDEASGFSVSPQSGQGVPPFESRWERLTGGCQGQFTLSLPGRYAVRWKSESHVIDVAPQKDLSFTSEFGIFSFVVTLMVGGMLLWLKRQKTKSVSAG